MRINDLEHLEVVSEEINITGGEVISQVDLYGFASGPNFSSVVGVADIVVNSFEGLSISKSYSLSEARAE